MSNHEQARARIHRVGQKENCTYIYLAVKDMVDEKDLKALQSKADFARTLVGALQETTSVNVDELKDKLGILIDELENSKVRLSGKDAEALDFLLGLLEAEMVTVK